MRSQAFKGFSEKMAATGSDDDAKATFKGDMEEDFGQEAKNATAKSDDAEASGKTW